MISKEDFIKYMNETQALLFIDGFNFNPGTLSRIEYLYTTNNDLYVYGVCSNGVLELQKEYTGEDKYELNVTNYTIYKDFDIVDNKVCTLQFLCHESGIYIKDGWVYKKLFV